jgi:hypothetical protein
MNSTRDLSQLPDVDGLRKLLQSLAMLDAMICPEWQYRYYSFNAHWNADEQMGSMRNGCGDDFFALFNAAGCFLKEFAHEAPMSPYAFDPPAVWPGVLSQVPEVFSSGLEEPAFKMTDTTFCIWRRRCDTAWQCGPVQFPSAPDPDGSEDLLSPLDGRPETYLEWAEGYYEQPIPLNSIRHVYDHLPLTEEVVKRLNPEVSLDDLADDIHEIGYPAPGSTSPGS